MRFSLYLCNGLRQFGHPQRLFGGRSSAYRNRALSAEYDESVVLRVLHLHRANGHMAEHLERLVERGFGAEQKDVGEL